MEKILLAIDASRVNLDTLDFGCYIAGLTRSKLTGVFLETAPALEAAYVAPAPASAAAVAARQPEPHQATIQLHEDSRRLFEKACEARHIRCNEHHSRNIPVYELIEESRFADILIVDASATFETHQEAPPTAFVKDLLLYAECPVIVAPHAFSNVDEIVFAYDGSASSVFAIKQFTYLFPGLNDKKATILHINEHEYWPAADRRRIAEWLTPHYSIINFRHLHGKPKDELYNFLHDKKNAFVVMGAFGRNMISRLFRSSSAEKILRTVDLPVFITHY